MSVDQKHQLDERANELLAGDQLSPPVDEWSRITAALDEPKRRSPLWLFFGALLVAASASAGAYLLINEQWGEHDSSATLNAAPVESPGLMTIVADSEDGAPSTSAAASIHPRAHVKASAREATTATQAGEANTDVSTESASTVRLESARKAFRSSKKNQPNGTQNEKTPIPTVDLPVEKSSSPKLGAPHALAPSEYTPRGLFVGEAVAGLPERSNAASQVELAFLGGAEVAVESVALPWQERLVCPNLAKTEAHELRVVTYGGLRHDSRINSAGTPGYLAFRDSVESTRLGMALGARMEYGKRTGFFAGIGLDYNYYGNKVAFFGPIRAVTRIVELSDPVSGQTIGFDTVLTSEQDVAFARNHHHTFTFTGSVGYRLATKRAAYYGAVDAGYEVVTLARGANYGADRSAYIYGSDRNDWVARSPGLALGLRLGADIDLVPGIGGEPSPWGLVVEASARRTGMFAGDADPLDYNLMRLGGSAGLRYTF